MLIIWSTVAPLIAARVPTGMKIGVCTIPCGVVIVPALALPSVASREKENADFVCVIPAKAGIWGIKGGASVFSPPKPVPAEAGIRGLGGCALRVSWCARDELFFSIKKSVKTDYREKVKKIDPICKKENNTLE